MYYFSSHLTQIVYQMEIHHIIPFSPKGDDAKGSEVVQVDEKERENS